MIKKTTIKNRLIFIVSLPLIVIFVISSMAVININSISDELRNTLYTEGYNSASLILNADRDMYQAVSAFQEWIKTGTSEAQKKETAAMFDENQLQTLERVQQAAEILKADEALWSSTLSSETGNTIFKILENFQTDFEKWVTEVKSTISSNRQITDFLTSDLYLDFEATRAYLDDAQVTLDEIANNQMDEIENQKMSLIYQMVAIDVAIAVILLLLSIITITSITKPLNKTIVLINKISQGDLSSSIDNDSKDEIGKMTDALNNLVENLHLTIQSIKISSEQVASGARQISDSSTQLSQGATEQASAIEELTASIEEISSQTKLNADNSINADKYASEAKVFAANGNEQMKHMLNAMNDINISSGNISKIIKVIEDIAFQTNILALNAAVEAARAGQYGKGFAVVSDEVRNLAAKSAKAAKETADLIEGSIKNVDNGTKIANETAEELKKIVEGVEKVAELVNSISIASNEQASGLSQVNQGIMQVSQVVQSNSATSEETAAASEELSGQAAMLEEQVSKFILKNQY